MKFIYVILIIAFAFSSQTNGMQQEFAQATPYDIEGIVKLMEIADQDSSEKIVIVPKKFRSITVCTAIATERQFVCRDGNNSDQPIVAMKKLYIVPHESQLETLRDEIRCINQPSVDHAALSCASDSKSILYAPLAPAPFDYNSNDVFIYNGGDYTHPAYRNQGVNSRLTQKAFQKINLENAVNQDTKGVHLLFGLTKANSGDSLLEGRTSSIIKAFVEFIKSASTQKTLKTIQPPQASSALTLQRFSAYMPSFDANNSECIPNSDEKSIPGFGYVLSFKVSLANKEQL